MIKFLTNTNPPLLGLGLTDGNFDWLKQGKPIIIKGREVAINHDIMIFWGKTEIEIVEQLKESGLVSDDDFNLINSSLLKK